MKKRNKKITVILSTILGLFVIGALCWSFVLCYKVLHPPRLTDLSWLTRQYPHTMEWIDSIRNNGLLHDIVRLNADGERLHARWLRAPEATGKTAVLFHGYQGSAEAILMIGYLYNHDLGFNVLIPDLRGHGQSEPSAVSMGWTERSEMVEWVRTADSLFGGDTQIVLYGVSMGAATAMIVSAEESLPACVRCAVEDCGYTSTRDVFADSWKKQSRLPLFPLFQLSDLWCRLLYGWSFGEASPLDAMRRCRLPMLFIHGDEDSVVPVEMVHRLYDAKIGAKELWILPGVAHGASYLHDPQAYTQRVRAFVEQWFECPAPEKKK